MRWEVEGRFKKEGTYVYLWLIHVDVWQKPTQYCKAVILPEKEMATHSSVLAWRIPGTEEPDGLPSMGCIKSDTTEET